jgi:hypothetical protein
LFVGQFENIEIGHVLRKKSLKPPVTLLICMFLFTLLGRFTTEGYSEAHQFRCDSNRELKK